MSSMPFNRLTTARSSFLLLLACHPATGQWLSPWLEREGHFYRLTAPLDWYSAEAQAYASGGHLVTVNDAAENEWLHDTFLPLDPTDRGFWLGLFQPKGSRGPDGGWMWISGEPVEFLHWDPDAEPNDLFPHEDMAHLFDYQGPSEWNDVPYLGYPVGQPTPLPGVVEVISSDCNDNAVPDRVDIVEGTSLDLDFNEVPDECDPDCDGDGIPDGRRLHFNPALDCNSNSILDRCDIAARTSNDCDANEIPDECETSAACPHADVNRDGVADGFDIALVRSGVNWFRTREEAVWPCADVNWDGVIDGFDIAVIRSAACWQR